MISKCALNQLALENAKSERRILFKSAKTRKEYIFMLYSYSDIMIQKTTILPEIIRYVDRDTGEDAPL